MKLVRIHHVDAPDEELVDELVRLGDVAGLLEELRCARCEGRLELLRDGRTLRCSSCYQGRVELSPQ